MWWLHICNKAFNNICKIIISVTVSDEIPFSVMNRNVVTGQAWLIRSHSSARISFELSGNLN